MLNFVWLKIKKIVQIKNGLIFCLFLVLLFSAGILLPFNLVLAGAAEKVVCMIGGAVLKLILFCLSIILAFAGAILELIMSHTLNVHNTDVVEYGWALTRDLFNMFFVIFLLIIAFATILRIEAYHYKVLLPKLILAILLVNFSRTICSVIIEFSNVLMNAFFAYKGPEGGEAEGTAISATALGMMLNTNKLFNLNEAYSVKDINDSSILISLATVVTLIALLTLAILGLTGLLVGRTIILLVLIVISPAAFVLNILPVTKSYFNQWWQTFLKWVFIGPIAAFFLYLATATAMTLETGSGVLGESLAKSKDVSGAIKAASEAKDLLPIDLTPDEIFKFMLVIGLMLASLAMIRAGGGMLADLAMKGAKVGMLGGAVMAGRFMGRRLSRSLAKGGRGPITRLAKRISPRLGKVSERVGKAARFLSPTVTREAWKARQAELDRRAYGESVAWAHKTLNRAFWDKDKTDYERLNQGALVNNEMGKLKAANPSGHHAYFREQFYKAIEANNMNRAEAAYRLLAEKGNANEIFRDIGRNPKLGLKLHSKEWIKKGKPLSEYSSESIRDVLYHVFGEERGRQIRLDMGEHGKQRGEWIDVEGVEYKDGKWIDKDPKKQAEDAAGEYNKLPSDLKNRQSRFTFAGKVEYNEKGEEINHEINPMIKIALKEFGYTETDANRVERFISPVTRGKLGLSAESVLREFKRIISEQKASSDPGERKKGELNERWLNAARGLKPPKKPPTPTPPPPTPTPPPSTPSE